MSDKPKHVTEQLALAVSEVVKARVPQFEGRAYINGAPGWNRESYPMCIVAVGKTKTTTVPSAEGRRTGRIQIRLCEIIVEFAALIPGDDAPARLNAQLAEITADVEDALAGFAGVPVSDIVPVIDSSLEDVETRDKRGLLGTRSLSFLATFHTVEGNSRAFHGRTDNTF